MTTENKYPKVGTTYWCIDENQGINERVWSYEKIWGRPILPKHQRRYDVGNFYLTEEAALHAIEVKKNYVKVLRAIKEKTDEYKNGLRPDLEGWKEGYFYFDYREPGECLGVVEWCGLFFMPKSHYFQVELIGTEILSELGEDAIKMFILEGNGYG